MSEQCPEQQQKCRTDEEKLIGTLWEGGGEIDSGTGNAGPWPRGWPRL